MINNKGELALASAVLVTLIDDITIFERTSGMKWKRKDKSKRDEIYRNASDAMFCTSKDINTLTLWLEIADIPINSFRSNITSKYPKTCAVFL